MRTPPDLRGRTVALIRDAERAESLAERLRSLGARVIVAPAIAYAPPADVDALAKGLAGVEPGDTVLFTSVTAVRAVTATGITAAWRPAGASPVIGAVGGATAAALREAGLAPAIVGEAGGAGGAAALVRMLGEVRGRRVVLPRSDLARPELPARLAARGAVVVELVAYRTVPADGIARLSGPLHRHAVDAIVFTSPSTARFLFEGLRRAGIARFLEGAGQPCVVCIGTTTAAAVRDEGLAVDVVAPLPSDDGLVSALRSCFASPRRRLFA